ncbi:MAG: hypothetical protein SOZ62_04710 [Eubacteriales bacterium]|nr:hypothetical protein [Eubacteriales bacterium]
MMRCQMREVPLSFMFAIAKDKSAIKNFVALDDSERAMILARVSNMSSKEEIENLAMSLSDDTGADELN